MRLLHSLHSAAESSQNAGALKSIESSMFFFRVQHVEKLPEIICIQDDIGTVLSGKSPIFNGNKSSNPDNWQGPTVILLEGI